MATTLITSPAKATDTSFMDDYYHGSGALAVRVTGGITWHNRSVTLTGVKLFVKSGECGRALFKGWAGSTMADLKNTEADGLECSPVSTAQGKWHDIPDFTLDGGSYTGGIREIDVEVVDVTHSGSDGSSWFYRD
ncbi:hypothetical protein AB0B66_20630 [Catellatospora sp. NPDC049111]|uniref:hypothetical protein n=1 Tax=Catellatospora sp. NPDC049111 TaxID=3155271 RepID=UPI00340EE15B